MEAGSVSPVQAQGPGGEPLKAPCIPPVRLLDLHTVAVALGLYALSRGLILLVGLLAAYTVSDDPHMTIGGGIESLGCRWDCGWYLGIAERGYSALSEPDQLGATNLAFFPLFPLLIRYLAQASGVDYLTAGLVVANLCFVAALIYVYAYARLVGLSRTAGTLAVALICFVPQGFVFSAVYTESLFLLLLVAAMFHMRRGHYLRSGIAAALLSAVRANGVLFLVFALAWIVRRFGAFELLVPWRRPQLFIPIVLAPLGLFLFWGMCYQLTGDAFAQASSVAHGWGWRSAFFLDNLHAHLTGTASARFWAISSLAVLACTLLLLRLRMYEELALCLAMLLLVWSGQIPNSLLRYSIVLFPAWIALAWLLERRPIACGLVFACISLFNGFLVTAWTLGKLIAI